MGHCAIFDIGHGEDTFERTGGKGLSNPRFEEHHFNSHVVIKAKELAEYNGIEILLTQQPFEDEVSLFKRYDICKGWKNKADVLMSFHANANGNKGIRGHSVFYWHTSPEGKELAQKWDKFADRYMDETKDRNVFACVPHTWTNFGMVRETPQYAILMEHAFFTNDLDRDLLESNPFIDDCAEVAVRTLCDFYNIPFRKPVKHVEKPHVPSAYEKELAAAMKAIEADGIMLDGRPNESLTRAQFAIMYKRMKDKGQL